jgi:hypothetical protein
MSPNAQRERREPAATVVREQTELNRLAAVRSKLWLGLRASSVSYWRFWAAVQQGDVDDWLGAIASKLDSGFHVGISLTAPVVPDPKTANEVRHRAI